MAILTINNAEMPAPSSLHVAIENSRFSIKRTLSGKAAAARAGVYRVLTCQWQYLAGSEAQTLLQAALGNPLQLTYPDPVTGEARQMNAVCSDHSVGLLRMRQGEKVWTQARLTFTEV